LFEPQESLQILPRALVCLANAANTRVVALDYQGIGLFRLGWGDKNDRKQKEGGNY
jgi:hypothetical protein